MDSIDGKIRHVWNLLRSNPGYRLRCILISETVILRVYKERLFEYRQFKQLAIARDLTWNRGNILEAFIKLEIIITELVISRRIGIFERDLKLEEKLEKMPTRNKILELRECGGIDQDLWSILDSLFLVRNDLAHSWSKEEANYLGNLLKDNFPKFKQDFEIAWTRIIEIYMQEQAPKVDPLIKKIESKIG